MLLRTKRKPIREQEISSYQLNVTVKIEAMRMSKRNVIEILYTDECPFWKEALKLIEAVIEESSMEISVKRTKISSLAEAKRLKFPGSPTVRINGVDIDPAVKETEGYVGCRIYRYKERMYEYPPREMIKSALGRMIQEKRGKNSFPIRA